MSQNVCCDENATRTFKLLSEDVYGMELNYICK